MFCRPALSRNRSAFFRTAPQASYGEIRSRIMLSGCVCLVPLAIFKIAVNMSTGAEDGWTRPNGGALDFYRPERLKYAFYILIGTLLILRHILNLPILCGLNVHALVGQRHLAIALHLLTWHRGRHMQMSGWGLYCWYVYALSTGPYVQLQLIRAQVQKTVWLGQIWMH